MIVNVLVLSPEGKDKKSRQRRQLIVRTLEDFKTKLLNPYPGRPPAKKIFRPPLFPQIFYDKETRLLSKTDLVIADLTDQDFRTGFLVSRALSNKKIVLGLSWQPIAEEQLSDWKKEDLFFTDYFNQDNIRSVLRHFLNFIRQKRRQRGKLIVIDGTDGSGKTTQAKLLVDYLRKHHYRAKYIDFPRYYSSFHGKMVGRYLRGDFGRLSDVNPYLASLTYALDRLTAREELEDWLRSGYIVVANRYTSSNMAHQTSRVKKSERKKFLKWLIEMEYKVHKLPQENITIFLHVPVAIGQKLVDKKGARGYLAGHKRDLHEASLKHLKGAEKMYLYLSKKFKHWAKIECLDKKGAILSRQKIHREIIKILSNRGLL